jgi:hypothetical protein
LLWKFNKIVCFLKFCFCNNCQKRRLHLYVRFRGDVGFNLTIPTMISLKVKNAFLVWNYVAAVSFSSNYNERLVFLGDDKTEIFH